MQTKREGPRVVEDDQTVSSRSLLEEAWVCGIAACMAKTERSLGNDKFPFQEYSQRAKLSPKEA
jgi:hypothetical protein